MPDEMKQPLDLETQSCIFHKHTLETWSEERGMVVEVVQFATGMPAKVSNDAELKRRCAVAPALNT